MEKNNFFTRGKGFNILFVSLLSILFLFSFVAAEEQSLGTFKQGNCVPLKQTCANCSYVNVTSVLKTGASPVQVLGNVPMTKTGTEYNYTLCNATSTGEYIYNTLGDLNGVNTVQPVSFSITPSGSTNILGLFIIMIVLVYAVGFIGFFGKHVWVSVLGGMTMIILGLYTMTNGIDIYRNFMTESFSWTSIGLGAIFSLTAAVELIQENL